MTKTNAVVGMVYKQGRLLLVKVVYPKAGPVVLSPGIDAASPIRNKASP